MCIDFLIDTVWLWPGAALYDSINIFLEGVRGHVGASPLAAWSQQPSDALCLGSA